jgi:DNA repair protein RadA/Sms
MMLGILERRAGLKLSTADCFVATVGGMRLLEPATDLATALAIVSSVKDISLPSGLVAIGELGLAGDIRRVTGLERRLAEAARLGFTDAMIPAGSSIKTQGITTHPVSNIGQAVSVMAKLTANSQQEGVPDF